MDLMRITLFLFLMILATSLSAQTRFPAVEDLPSRPELPDPLIMFDGTPVETPEDWYAKRRPELKALFQHYVYGYLPESPGINAKVVKTDRTVFGGKAVLKEIDITFKGLENSPVINVALFMPNRAGRFPVFMMLNRCGNHSLIDHPNITIDEEAWAPSNCISPKEDGRGEKTDFYCVEYLIDHGYAFATFCPSSYAPDVKDFTGGIFDCFDPPGPKETDWRTISAWAWGLHRVVDYLVTDWKIDRNRICVTGHSRRGKTALLAGAMDERISLVVPHQSGTGGCALSRNNDQETVERINRAFPHWFNDVFPTFGDNEDKLPVDQHLLIALVAPRPLLDTEGKRDAWANPPSALKAVQAADKVYKFLGAEGVTGSGFVEDDQDITQAGNLVQYRGDTVHTLNRDYWKVMLDFADAKLK